MAKADAFKGKGPLDFQARFVAQRARHILPPRKKPGQWEFAILIGREGEFQKFVVVKKSNSKNPKAKIVKRVSHLDLSIVCQFVPKRRVTFKELIAYNEQTNRRMIECLKTTFFSVNPSTLGASDYGTFFEDDDNFALNCRRSHDVLDC